MDERESEREVTSGLDVDLPGLSRSDAADGGRDVDAVGETQSASEDTTGRLGVRSRLRPDMSGYFSLPGFLIAVVLAVCGLLVGSLIPLLGIIGHLLGVGAGTMVYGLVATESRYIETALAGALAVGGSVVLGNLFAMVLGVGAILAGGGFVTGAIAGGVGHYFGRDLRDGLTRDLGDPPS